MVGIRSVLGLVACHLLFASTALAQVADPVPSGTRAITELDYGAVNNLVTLNGRQVEFFGRAYFPTNVNTGEKLPVVLFMHGDHATCYVVGSNPVVLSTQWPCPAGQAYIPSYLGFAYLAQQLASHGMIVSLISANGTNPIVGGTAERMLLIDMHLAWWDQVNRLSTGSFADLVGHVDLSRVAEIGHSKGGEAVIAHGSNTPPPGLRAVLAIAPARPPAAPLPTLVHKAFAVILGYCDGDLGTSLEGLGYYDQARYVDPTDEGTKYSFLLLGGNHNYFNRSWTPTGAPHQGDFGPGSKDDWTRTDRHCGATATTTGRLDGPGQRKIATGYISAFLRKHLLFATQFDPILKGEAALPTAPAHGEVHVGYLPPAGQRMDLNRFTSDSDLVQTFDHGPISCPGFVACTLCTAAGCKTAGVGPDRVTHFASSDGIKALKMNWTSSQSRVSHPLPSNRRDVSSLRTLQFRVAQAPTTAGTDAPPLDFFVEIRGPNNTSASVPVSNYAPLGPVLAGELYYPPGAVANKAIVMNTLRIPMSAFTGVDLSRAVSVDFVMHPQLPVGNLLVTDIAFVEPTAFGYSASYSNDLTYGVTTGTAHTACNFPSTGQICALPTSETIHWCFDASVTAAQRTRLGQLVPMFNAVTGIPMDITPSVDLGFKFIKHTSCSDAAVSLVIDTQTCSGTNSANMRGYVCTTFADVSAPTATLLTLFEDTEWTFEGTYYTPGGKTTLHLDMADQAASVPGTNGDNLLKHAVFHGLGWMIGLGSRTDKPDLYTSSAVVPYAKSGWSAPEICRAKSFRLTAEKNTFRPRGYCGWDSPTMP